MAGAGREASACAVTRLIAAIVILLCAGFLANDAFAHAALVSAEPRDGSVLASPPNRVELRFSESVVAGAVTLIDANGKLREDAAVDAKDEMIAVTVPADLPRGTAVISYRVISQDGHPVAGSVAFSIGEPSATRPVATSHAAVDTLIWLARVGLYLGLFAGVGGVFFMNWIAQRRVAPRAMLGFLAVGMVSAAGSLGFQGLDVLGLPLSGLLARAPWKIALGTSLGPSLLIAFAAMVAASLSLLGGRVIVLRALSACAFVGVGLALAASGHAATAPPQILTRPVMFLHALGVTFWLGALLPLSVVVWRERRAALPIVGRFSALAVPIVGLLALSGVPLAVVQLESVHALFDTSYGLILLAKLVLVTVILLLAARHRFRLTPALARDASASQPLSRSIAVECAVAVVLLAVVAGWRFTPPPRALSAEGPVVVHIHTDKAMFVVLVSPARTGLDDFVLQLMHEDGSPLSAKEARLTLSMPSRGIESIERQAALGGDGQWHVTGVPLSVPGRWHLQVDALVSDFQEISLEDDFDVASQ
jgi:copper transport protein